MKNTPPPDRKGGNMAANPRWKTGKRRQYQQRLRAMGLPCAICGKQIDYTAPYYIVDEEGRKHINKWAFVIDEIIPVSKWQEGGYNSAAECANDFTNLQPAHAICNAIKGDRMGYPLPEGNTRAPRPRKKEKKYNCFLPNDTW